MKKIIFVYLLIAIFLPNLGQAQESAPDIAWISDGVLWLAGENHSPTQVAENITFALFSPQGSHLAYITAQQDLTIIDPANPTQPLYTVTADTFPPETLLGYLRWQGENLLWFNTLENPTARSQGNLLHSNWSLWVANLADQSVTSVSNQGRGGVTYPSPDGKFIIWLHPGRYGEIPATVTLYNEFGDQLMTWDYEAVSSGSHLDWLPQITWVDGIAYSAIPDSNLLYTFETPYPPTHLVNFDPSRSIIITIAEIQTTFPAQVLWSDDASQVAYFSPTASGYQLIVQTLATGERLTIIENASPEAVLLTWADDLIAFSNTQGMVFWSDEKGLRTRPQTWGVTQTTQGDYVLADGVPTGRILVWDGQTEIVIAENINPNTTSLILGLQ